jgi:hypothetical protein
MYMAYDWSVKSRVGRSIIYTDDKGMRQRGVLLPTTMSHVGAHFMPMRVWGGQIKPFVKRLMESRGNASLTLETEFMETNKPYGLQITDKSIFVLMRANDARRSLRLMRGEQVKIRKDAHGERATAAVDPLNVTLGMLSRNGRMGRGRADAAVRQQQHQQDPGDVAAAAPASGIPQGYVALRMGLDTTVPEHLDRALDLLMRGTGLEIYAKGMQQRALAKEVGREYFQQIRIDTAQRRDQVRQEIAAAATRAEVPAEQDAPAANESIHGERQVA